MISPKTVFITGCNRGIGLTFVKHLLKLESPPTHIYLQHVDRRRMPRYNIDFALQELREIASENPSVTVVKVEVTDQTSIDAARATVEAKLEGRGLSLLINNAATTKRMKLEEVTPEAMMEIYEVNCVAPLMITKAFIPLLKSAANEDADKPMSCSRAAIINISSNCASISENSSGGHYGYRASKVALNMVTSNLALELKSDGIIATVVHPGWVKTEMGGPNAKISTEQSVKSMMNILSKLQGEGTGKFYHVEGHVMDW